MSQKLIKEKIPRPALVCGRHLHGEVLPSWEARLRGCGARTSAPQCLLLRRRLHPGVVSHLPAPLMWIGPGLTFGTKIMSEIYH